MIDISSDTQDHETFSIAEETAPTIELDANASELVAPALDNLPEDEQAGFPTAQQDGCGDLDDSEGGQPSPGDPRTFVRQYMEMNELECLFDGSIVQRGAPLTAHTREMIDAVLAVQPLNVSDLLDMMIIYVKANGLPHTRTSLSAATRQVIREAKHDRRNFIMRPLLNKLPPSDMREDVSHEWDQISSLFDMPQFLCTAIFQHFIWQVKQKVLGRPIVFHLMPIIMSEVQGSGKTTFVKMFLGPLRELATGASLLSDFSDRRTLGLFRYPAVLIDDMEMIGARAVPILKSTVTADELVRRQLGSSSEVKVRQVSTLIGTSNSPIDKLIPDDTGHRRFVVLPFYNGQVARGGDERIWRIVSSLNYDLLWKWIDAFEASPLIEHVAALTTFQKASETPTGLLKWLLELDVESPAVKRISTTQGVRAQPLHNLYADQTGQVITKQAFASEMLLHMKNGGVPFIDKAKVGHAAILTYRWNPPAARSHAATTGVSSEVSPVSAASPASDISLVPEALNASAASAASAASEASDAMNNLTTSVPDRFP